MSPIKKDHTDTLHYIITFVSLAVLIGCFASHMFTGRPAVLQFDSLKGSILLGTVFLLYQAWFVYTDHVLEEIPLSQSIKLNLTKNATGIFIGLYWLILVIVPAVCSLF